MGTEDNGQRTRSGKIEYPVYRRTPDGRHFYCIEAKDSFVEIQVVGNRHLLHRVTARAYPELVRIMEMVEDTADRYRTLEKALWLEELERSGND